MSMTPHRPVVVALGQKLDLDAYRAEIDRGERPRHVLLEFADRTGGRAVSTSGMTVTTMDRLMGKIVGRDTLWHIAWHLRRASRDGFVYGNGEAIGFALLLLAAFRPSRARNIGFYVMTPRGARVRWWLRLIRILRLAPIITVETERKAAVVRAMVGPRCAARLLTLLTPVDTDFFSPGTTAPPLLPTVASAGRERRDYATLAAAIDGLAVEGPGVEQLDAGPAFVDVEVCAVSPDAADSSATMPASIPATMRFVDLDMAGLRDLYRRAAVVAVPTTDNEIDAGFTSVLEAMACARPVIVSQQGAQVGLVEAAVAVGVPVGDAAALRAELSSLITDSARAASLGERARRHAIQMHGTDRWLDEFVAHLKAQGALGRTASPR